MRDNHFFKSKEEELSILHEEIMNVKFLFRSQCQNSNDIFVSFLAVEKRGHVTNMIQFAHIMQRPEKIGIPTVIHFNSF